MPNWWEVSDKIEIPATEEQSKSIPPEMKMNLAWPESVYEHWQRLYETRRIAKENGWPYAYMLPRRMRNMCILRRAFDGLPCPAWAAYPKEKLQLMLVVDANRQPVPYLEAIKPWQAFANKGFQYRDARIRLQRAAREERLQHHEETVAAVAEFRRSFLNGLVYWELCNPKGLVWNNRFKDERPLFVSQISQDVQGRDRNYLTIILLDEQLKPFTLAVVDFRAWIEDGCFYITEFPYYGVTGRKMTRQRLRKVK